MCRRRSPRGRHCSHHPASTPGSPRTIDFLWTLPGCSRASCIGALLILIAYTGYHMDWTDPRNPSYNILNPIGSIILVLHRTLSLPDWICCTGSRLDADPGRGQNTIEEFTKYQVRSMQGRGTKLGIEGRGLNACPFKSATAV